MAYVSDELTHFVGRGKTGQEQYDLLKTILRTGQLKPPALPQNAAWKTSILHRGRVSQEEVFNTTVVCFCDIPVADLETHMGKFSRFGVAFPKRFMISRAANPVFYVGMDLTLSANNLVTRGKPDLVQEPGYWDEGVQHYLQIMGYLPDLKKTCPDMPSDFEISRMLNMFDLRILSFIKPVDLNKLDDDRHVRNVYMEREWRIVGKLEFALADVSRVVLPKTFVDEFQKDIPALAGKLWGV